MKTISTLFLLLMVNTVSAVSNSLPVVSNITSSVDKEKSTVRVTFDLADSDDNSLLVTFAVSSDSGLTFLMPIDSVWGNVGYPVAPGTRRNIYWHYNASQLNPSGKFIAKIIADDRHTVDIRAIVDQVDSTRIWNDLCAVAGVRSGTPGMAHLNEVRNVLIGRVQARKLQLSEHLFQNKALTEKNIIGRKPGLTNEKATFFIGAHYDGVVNSPAADDNATGVAGVLEAISVLAPYSFAKSIEFIFFDGEEDGAVGSKAYVGTVLPSYAYKQVEGLLNLDAIGYYLDTPNSQQIIPGFTQAFPAVVESIAAHQYKGDFMAGMANVQSHSLRVMFDDCAASYVPEIRIISFEVPGNSILVPNMYADHEPFWRAGYKALWMTDGGGPFRIPTYYHAAGDSVGLLNKKFLAQGIKTIIATLASLAEPLSAGYGVSDLFAIPVSVGRTENAPPRDFYLFPNYPNPFNASTLIRFDIKKRTSVTLNVFNAIGQEISAWNYGQIDPGNHTLEYNAKDLPSGMYFYRLEAGGVSKTMKMTLIK